MHVRLKRIAALLALVVAFTILGGTSSYAFPTTSGEGTKCALPPASDDDDCAGRAAHQGPDTDGECVFVEGEGPDAPHVDELAVGDLVRARVVDSEGVDLVVEAVELLPRGVGEPVAAAVSG